MEFRRAHLYDINPGRRRLDVLASSPVLQLILGAFGETAGISSFIALRHRNFIAAPVLAWLTQGRYYVPARDSLTAQRRSPAVSGHRFETEDIDPLSCLRGAICSLCCSSHPAATINVKPIRASQSNCPTPFPLLLPRQWVDLLNTRLGHFLPCSLSGLVILRLYCIWFIFRSCSKAVSE